MSHYDDDEIELRSTSKAADKPTPPRSNAGFVKDGTFTDRGKERLRDWCSYRLVKTPGYGLDLAMVLSEFEDSDSGFPFLDDVKYEETLRILSELGVEQENDYRWRDRMGVTFGGSAGGIVEPIDWLIDGIIPRGAIVGLVAPSYELKTWLALSMARAVSHEEPWLGRHAINRVLPWRPDDQTNPLRSLHLDYETTKTEVTRRLTLLKDTRTGHASVSASFSFALSDEKLWNEELPKLEPDLVTIDSLSRGNPGVDEKDSRFAEPLARAGLYAKLHKTTFIFVAHCPKDMGSKSLVDIFRGTTATPANLDVVYLLQAVPSGSNDPRERRARVTCKKMRQGGEDPAPFTVKLTDAGGIELVERKPREVVTDQDDEIIFRAIESHGDEGVSGSALAGDLEIRKQETLEACRRLKEAGRIAAVGAGRAAKFVVT